MSNILKRSRYRQFDDVIHIHIPFKRESETNEQVETVPDGDEEVASEIVQVAKREAEQIINDAKENAEKIIQETREKIDAWWREQREQDESIRQQVKDEAYQEGYAQGYETGQAEGLQQLEEQLNDARQLIETAYTMKEDIIQEAEPFLVELAVDIAETVIRTEISRESTVVLNIVRHALAECQEAQSVSIFVRPEHASLVHEARHELKELLDRHAEIRVIPDHSLSSDGCIIRTEKGSINASTEVQLNQIRDVLLEVSKEGDGSDDTPVAQVSTGAREREPATY